ncbi:GGDEF domain-containing protein [Bradyrhizobium sp.]|uniref:GGDEF domain-containing protein n=1 Tax=Bradyrhizobium sp. TaxID=376 RepID=UPI0023A2FA07|nr:GGDEF domain-containing protein [Bradyrhizobium sp.]MDE2379270.1 GGDEF domain-containing protein [Bradyrhizobium sp.]
MATAASPFLVPTAAELDAARRQPTAEVRARRARQRRQIQAMVAVSYLLDTGILAMYAHAGIIAATIPFAYAGAGLLSIANYLVLSETGINDRFRDHYLVAPQSAVSMLIMLTFTYNAPEVGVVFLCSLFTVFGFGALRSAPQQTAAIWTVMVLGLAFVFLLTDKPIAVPMDGRLERLATMLVFALNIGRCMFLGIFSSGLSQSLYQSGLKLKEAYRRIEELAELDELTGSFNRGCIMRHLDQEIANARTASKPCSVALIDLDWFKRINDAHGHPVGDEVLRTFAITIFANIRPVDRFGRYGGEEFLLLLPGTEREGAARVLDRLRMIVADLDWSAFSPGMQVTISAGVAELHDNDNADTLLARADGALYSAKAQGRNRIATS